MEAPLAQFQLAADRCHLAADLVLDIRRCDRAKLAEGKTKKEALRALKRRVSDAVWRP